ncbi:SDR family NAD(P)-dependent oxidoreductase [Micromonospora sp. CB01531]|uniref:SDR family NAD(P)-dependent oxidoreductase n=1 Tax=Micromonospora sp. CB01531 TaxID=1718947 RepID=UPI000938E7C8|nr:SDR family NAD(P)-dependent oxidoreductase [Micromonospora sp. CB01531]OKI44019.1 hypothetical protein A6A27_38675 [Micromonospora sp. CB01531]
MAVWFVTDAAQGLGKLIATQSLQRGNRVIAGGADAATGLPRDVGQVLSVPLNILDEGSVKRAANHAMSRFGRIDVLVNSVHHRLHGAVEETSTAEAMRVFEINVLGLLNVARAVLPVMRRQRSGRVLTISSAASITAQPGWGLSAAGASALGAVGDALREELLPLGILVTTIEPGRLAGDAPATASRRTLDDYPTSPEDVVPTTGKRMLGDPGKVASVIVDLASATDPPARLRLGADAVASLEGRLDLDAEELDAWRPTSLSIAPDPPSHVNGFHPNGRPI